MTVIRPIKTDTNFPITKGSDIVMDKYDVLSYLTAFDIHDLSFDYVKKEKVKRDLPEVVSFVEGAINSDYIVSFHGYEDHLTFKLYWKVNKQDFFLKDITSMFPLNCLLEWKSISLVSAETVYFSKIGSDEGVTEDIREKFEKALVTSCEYRSNYSEFNYIVDEYGVKELSELTDDFLEKLTNEGKFLLYLEDKEKDDSK